MLPPTLKIILKTYYQAPVRPQQQQEISSCSQEEHLKTSIKVQLDDRTGKHRDREHNPLERQQVSEKEKKLVGDGTSHADQGGEFVFQTEVRSNFGTTSQVATRHLELATFRQQQQ